MLMVIFGAGASFDCLSDEPAPPKGLKRSRGELGYRDFRPPLANQLFERRDFFDQWISQYYECGPIVRRLRQLPDGSNFEHELETLREEGAADPQRWVQLHAIRYYLRQITRHCGEQVVQETKGITNYADLLDQIRHWRVTRVHEEVAFVTFNYDTLLEHGCGSALGLSFPTITSYTSQAYRVYKPHGSWNWVRLIESDVGIDATNPEHSIISQGKRLTFREGYHVVDASHGAGALHGHFIFPAIALPVETKSDFECPRDHLEKLVADISSVTRLLLIGWRATEAHFLKLWEEQPRVAHLSKVAIVAGRSREAESVRDYLKRAGIGEPKRGRIQLRETKFLLSDQGFSDLLTSGKLDEFFAD